MQKALYQILGITPDATNEQVLQAYNNLKAKYSEERFLEGDAGNYAAKMLTEIEIAYNDIMQARRADASQDQTGSVFADIEAAIRKGDISAAQQLLDNADERTGEWHYLQSVVFYKKNWTNESKKQLELAMRLEPSNEKFKDAYKKLDEQINFNAKNFTSGNAAQGGGFENQKQMGGDACSDAANCCSTMLCMNCLLNCCCGCR